jgi:hypothetical protein
MLLGIGQASAEITRGEDTFTGGATINSVISTPNPADLDGLVFRKFANTDPKEYELWANRITSKSFLFSNTAIEIKIDSYPTEEIAIKKNGLITLADGRQYSHITAPLTSGDIEKIKMAKRIALKFPTAVGSYVYILPDAVLAEWKEVIAAEK